MAASPGHATDAGRAAEVLRPAFSLNRWQGGEALTTQRAEAAPRPNRTGLPDGLKSASETLSGVSLDDVRVVYGSPQPARMQALAYARGREIHVGPGQERFLPHEAWHIVQQKQGRVRPSFNVVSASINDDRGLEREADLMGARASQLASTSPGHAAFAAFSVRAAPDHGEVLQGKGVVKEKLNVVGETHPESNEQRQEEQEIAREHAGGKYWREGEFKVGERSFGDKLFRRQDKRRHGDSPRLRMEFHAAQLSDLFFRNKEGVRSYESLISSGKPEDLQGLVAAVRKGLADIENVILNVAGNNNAVIESDQRWPQLVEACTQLGKELAAVTQEDDAARAAARALRAAETLRDVLTDAEDDGVEQAHEGLTAPISRLRSMYMDKSAVLGAARKGVWKIGDDHVTDIRGFGTEPVAYNLLSKSEFYETYADELPRR